MADFEEPKEFAFGDLNPVQKPRTSPTADPGSISILDALKEVVVSHYTPDATRGTGPYKGIVLRVEEDMDQNNPAPGNWLATIFGAQGMFASLNPFSMPKTLKRYKVRIPEIHVSLPSPQKYAESPTEQGDHQKIINMYPTFIAHNSNTEEAGPGDVVWVDFGNKENFEDPTFLGPVFPPPDGGGGSGSGGGGASGSDAFGDCGGGGGLSGAAGGSIGSAAKIPVTSANVKWKNAMYLDAPETSKRNKNDPMKPVLKASGYSYSSARKYVAAGGSGRAITGKMGLGTCANINNELAKWLTAMRIVVEDQADRGYMFGGKILDPTKGGIDCSGFVCGVRNMMEFLIYPDLPEEGINGYKLVPEYTDWRGKVHQKNNWRRIGLLVRPQYGTLQKPKAGCVKHVDGWDWVSPMSLVKAGKNPSDVNYYKDFLNRCNAGEFGALVPIPTHYFEVEGSFHFMPGDEITHTPTKPPKWAKSKLGISHIMTIFTDPDGNLRLAESGGPHSGTGSMPLQQYLDNAKRTKKKIWCWQRPEWSWLWAQLGGRPNQPWTPELCNTLTNGEYFSVPNLAAEATENGKKEEVKNEDGTSTEKDAGATVTPDGQTPAPEGDSTKPPVPKEEPKPKITAQNITKEQALALAESQQEKDEVNALPQDATSSQIAETAAGKKALAKSIEEAKAGANASTPASGSTASQNVNPAPAPAPIPVGGCGGGSYAGAGSYSSGGSFTVGADRAGTPVGNIPFIGTLGEVRNNPKMKKVKIPFDRIGKQNWYADPRVREDVAANIVEVKKIANELGALLGSSGASRSLSAKVGPGRSATSFHYTSLALDLVVPSMMVNPDTDNHVIEFDPENNKRFIVWARSSKTSGSVTKGGVTFEVEHKTLNAILQKKGSPPAVGTTTGYFVNITKLMRAHGLEGIGGTKNWYKNCSGASEAWHFDFRLNAGFTVGSTTFGMTLETMYNPSTEPPWAYASRVWRGGSFK